MGASEDALPDRALASFVRDHRERLRAALHTAFPSLSGERIEDAVQEALTRALEAGRKMDTEDEWVSYLFVVARNVLFDELRSAYTRQVALDGDLAARAQLPAPDVADEVVQRHDWQAVVRAWRGLVPEQREVLVLRYIEGLMPAAIAPRLGIGIRAVESRLRRARNALQAAARVRDREHRAVVPIVLPVGPRPSWFGRVLRHALTVQGAAVSMSMLSLAVPPAVVLIPSRPSRNAQATAREPAPLVLRGTGDAEAPGDGDASTPLRFPSPAAPLPAASPSSPRPTVPNVKVSVRRCVEVERDAEVCGGVGRKPPPGRQPRPYVKVPAIAGQEERYLFVDSPVPGTCDYVPNTAVTGCVPGEPSPSSTPTTSP